MFHNTSDSALDDLALHDIVPGTFSIESSSVKSSMNGDKEASFTKESARDGNKVTWSIGRIEMNERIEVVYEIQGDTEAEYKVSDAQDFHGATFGKEVDEVPNVPEWAESVVDTPLITLPLSKPINDVEVSSNDHKEPNNDSEDYDLNLEEENLVNIDSNKDTDNLSVNSCPICMSDSEIGESVCVVCGYSFK